MSFKFQKAVKSQARLRLALEGPSGSGKTYTALSLAVALGGPVAVIDTERASASLYADKFNFDTLNLDSFSPDTYVEAIKSAEDAGYKALVIDSLSHAWMGKDGALEMADQASRKPGNNRFTAWRDVTPKHNRLIDAILGSKMHIICTMRTKTEWVLEENDRGKQVPRKVGMQSIQRDGMEYEFTVVGDMDLDNNLVVSKTRCSALAGKVFNKPGKDFAGILLSWLDDGAPEAPKPVPTTLPVASQSTNWTARISECKSLEDLDALLKQIRAELPPDTQKSLVEPWRTRKQELSANGQV